LDHRVHRVYGGFTPLPLGATKLYAKAADGRGRGRVVIYPPLLGPLPPGERKSKQERDIPETRNYE